jgi:hydantoinase/carbamoylase family amidase
VTDSRLDAWVDELASFGGSGTAVDRPAWSPPLLAANAWLVERLTELGLAAGVDAAGNVVGRWEAGTGPAVLVGSHLDTVPRGGRFDGALGVVAAVEAVRRLREEGFTPARPLHVIAFSDEEGARFGSSMSGSRAFVGDDVADLADRTDDDGTTFRRAMADAGADFDAITTARAVDDVRCYLELHVEQGPRMVERGLQTAVVRAIVGVLGHVVELHGQVNHAGTTPMDGRRDALAGAARVVLELREAVRARPGATCNIGKIAVEPGGSNVVPGTCRFSVDVRAEDGAGLDDLDALVAQVDERAAGQERLTAQVRRTHRHEPVPLDDGLQALLGEQMTALGLRWDTLVSRAGHDAQVLAPHVPTGMLFVPSEGGISHAPEELTTPEQREPGVQVLVSALRALCS